MRNPFRKQVQDTPDASKGRRVRPSKLTKASRFVMLLGDEGAILIHLKEGRVEKRLFAPAPAAESDESKGFAEALAADSGAPIYLLADTMDQTYMQQVLPPVTSLSVGKLVRRRLDRDFGPEDIKGAISLGREKAGRKDWNYLLVALEKTPALNAWLKFLLEFPNRFAGIFLVPVEAEIMVRQLEAAWPATRQKGRAVWQFLVSHNKVGGFRQVILKNGRVVFTRLAQPVGEATPEVVAGNIEQEVLSTIEYMKRLGYQDAAGLDLFIIVSADIKKAIDNHRFNVSLLKVLTPHEVAVTLDLQGATQPEDRFGDVVLAACIGRSQRFVLKLNTPQTSKLDQLYQVRLMQRIAAGLIVAGLLLFAGMQVFDFFSLTGTIEDLGMKKKAEQRNYDELLAQVEKYPEKIDKIVDMVELYDLVTSEAHSPLDFLASFSMALPQSVRVVALDWSLGDLSKVTRAAAPPPPRIAPAGAGRLGAMGGKVKPPPKQPQPILPMQASVRLSFSLYQQPNEAFIAEAQLLLARLKEALPGYRLKYASLPGTVSETERLDVTLGNSADRSSAAGTGPIEVELKVEALAESPPGTAKAGETP